MFDDVPNPVLDGVTDDDPVLDAVIVLVIVLDEDAVFDGVTDDDPVLDAVIVPVVVPDRVIVIVTVGVCVR